MRDLRRIVVAVVIGSFSIAALMGIIALLQPGPFGQTEGRVLLTTVIVGVESVAALCYLSLSGRPWAAVGAVGATVSLAATIAALLMTWGNDSEVLGKFMGVSALVAATFAQASLLISLAGRRRTVPLLVGTLTAAAAVCTMISVLIITDHDPAPGFGRTLGVVAILDALGTVVLVALAIVVRLTRSVGGVAGQAPLVLVPSVETRLVAAATLRGVTPSELVGDALDALEASDRERVAQDA